jgi:hypothetical protein
MKKVKGITTTTYNSAEVFQHRGHKASQQNGTKLESEINC